MAYGNVSMRVGKHNRIMESIVKMAENDDPSLQKRTQDSAGNLQTRGWPLGIPATGGVARNFFGEGEEGGANPDGIPPISPLPFPLFLRSPSLPFLLHPFSPLSSPWN